MNLCKWVESNVQYGRELASSSLEGANSGREEFLGDTQLRPFLGEAAVKAIKVATIGAGLGVLGACLSRRGRHAGRALGLGALGGAIGFGAGFTWKTRGLGARMGSGALRKMDALRGQRWLERNPIDYA